MPCFELEALEKFVVSTIYYVQAASAQEAEALCRAGKVAYEFSSIEEGDEEWIETVSITETTDPPADPADFRQDELTR